MDPHPLRRLRRAPRAAGVLEVPDEFFLFRIDRDRRLLRPLRRAHPAGDVAKLGVPIGVLTTFAGLDVALQAIAQAVQQLGDHGVADVVAQAVERHGQGAGAQARPAQRRVRIAGRRRLDQGIQVPSKVGSRSVARFRPPPALRVRVATSASPDAKSRRPR